MDLLMDKKLFLSIATLAIVVVSGYNMYRANINSVKLSDLALANVEALSIYEVYPNGYCYSDVRTEKEYKEPSNGGGRTLIKHCEYHSCNMSPNGSRTCTQGDKCEYPNEPYNSYDNVLDIPCVE